MTRSVLVVDDDAALREALADALTDEGYAVSACVNGLEALVALRAGLRPDVIVLDLMMPVMDGWRFREEQARDPDLASIPVVVITAASALRQPIEARAIVRKPFRLEELFGVFASLG